ncbi:class II fructose-bisphosphate aldolase [Roseburia sp. 1XD42-34]|uniref:class II fructose-bisphosphate aldolase n=1 Tax=Roseburia sp. 1XD42-34 TaxID=2305905 RepID=UPI00269473F1
MEAQSPVILAVTPGAMNYVGRAYIQAIAEVAAKENDIPMALHLDHHETLETIEESLKLGTKSVMIDGLHSTFEENIKLTKRVVEISLIL